MVDTAPAASAEERDAWLALVLAGGAIASRQMLLTLHGSAAAALSAGPAAWLAAGCDDAQRAALAQPPSGPLRHARRWLEAAGHHFIGWDHPAYPPLLRESPQPPLALFVAGEPALLAHPGVAIVGSRRPSAGGRDHAGVFAEALAQAGLAVVSGLAAGIDAAAHEAALGHAAGLTLAILGTGPDVPYPARHAALQARMAREGAVASEYPPGTPARAGQFPSRNRIVAGLTLGTLVVEAAHRSGALITARLAGEAGREVFAIPGSIHNPMARGCHRLIRDGATLVESADDVLAVLGPLAASRIAPLRGTPAAPIEVAGRDTGRPPLPANPDYQRLWQALGHDPIPMDSLVQRTGLTAAALSSMLLAMELEGRVVVRHGRYMRYP
ncbi:DNA processing protein DprA [Stenotrophomonas panacihumi]|uniref:DNA processing protein DprA n=1 Tax=Stenotrophomonas panacihumi TaxID=676599 RepID=A0A0R0A7W7_9GAMM|nr:DNA-processing protein DprA [Stenotrophomonas panacihumi]KRG37409.1 DNA processing protein DprA [Stenotrophomonas panacihumi]PTN55518.1 DNA-protecting protein DprA [Stenotrophomonas panacihumi]